MKIREENPIIWDNQFRNVALEDYELPLTQRTIPRRSKTDVKRSAKANTIEELRWASRDMYDLKK